MSKEGDLVQLYSELLIKYNKLMEAHIELVKLGGQLQAENKELRRRLYELQAVDQT